MIDDLKKISQGVFLCIVLFAVSLSGVFAQGCNNGGCGGRLSNGTKVAVRVRHVQKKREQKKPGAGTKNTTAVHGRRMESAMTLTNDIQAEGGRRVVKNKEKVMSQAIDQGVKKTKQNHEKSFQSYEDMREIFDEDTWAEVDESQEVDRVVWVDTGEGKDRYTQVIDHSNAIGLGDEIVVWKLTDHKHAASRLDHLTKRLDTGP